MHPTRSPSSIPTGVPGDALDLSLSGAQLSMSKRPSSASPGKYFSRSVSVSVASDSRGKRNTLSDASFGSSRSIKNLRRSNSTTQVNQQANISLSQDQSEDYLSLFDSSSDGRKKLASLSKASPDRTTWNILDDQPRAFPLHSSSHSTGSVDSPTSLKKRESGIALAATFTANNRSNKGAVGNSVTTILHNNYSEKPLTPKSSNQKPSFNNILKATANDEVSLENGSLTKSQKNFSSVSSTSNNRSPVSAQQGSPVLSRRREATEEEAERFIQQVNQAAVTIQRWYRRHAKRRHANQAALKRILASKRKEWEERTEEDGRLEQQQKKDEDRKRIREEKARLARLAAIQELQQKRAQRVAEVQHVAEVELESLRQAGVVGRRKPPRISPTNRSPASPSNNSPMSPTDVKAKNTDSNLNVVADLGELTFRAISPALSNNRGSQCSQDQEDRAEVDVCLEQQHLENDRKLIRKEKTRLARLAANQTNSSDELQQKRAQRIAEVQHVAEVELDNMRQTGVVGRKKPPKISPVNKSPASPINNSPMSPTDVKAKNTDSNLNIVAELGELSSFRAVSPALSNCRASQCSQEILQRSVSVEDQRQGASSSRAQSKTTLNELLDTLKLLEEEPERLSEPKSYRKEKYAWIDEDGDSNSLTTDNLERHGQLSHHPALPDGGALLSEAKLQSIMSFLDEMEKSEQERPRSVTSGSHREAVLSEEELVGVEQASATAAEVTGSMMRIKLELEEKKRTVNMLQTALAQQRELTMRHVKETEKELSRNFQLQKEQYESTIQRHLTFIDQLINDKKALSERCEGVVGELKQVDQKYTKKIAQMQEQHEMVWQILGPLCEEIKKLKELMSATEKIRREKWIDEKTKKIKEITVKGLEPEIQKLISKHKQELKKLRTLHEAELLQADDRVAQRYVRQCEELRQQLEREKEEQCQREREIAKQRYEKQLQEEEQSLQQQRRRLYKEVADEKERLAELAARQRAELEDLRRQLEENSSLAGRALRVELDKTREEQERRHQLEMKALQERLDIEKQSWEENYKKKEEVWLLSRERELKEDLRRERDKEIELAIWTLEEETSKDKEECERAAENRVKRVREKYEAELRDLERSERAAVEKQQELRKQQMEMEGELIRLQALLRQKEQEAEDITQTRDKLVEERRSLAEVIRQEFADRLVMTEEENSRMKVEVSEVRARLRLEVERVTREKEEELAEVHQRVKSAILKKEETVSCLRKQHEAALKRADHLEALWEQQRKQLLEK
ncbi:centrosomal protein of 131 kDa isoform X1 [Larimichthys crocea]|uniref:centrosomal protein of 131 kDa isoform X1 n=1 Tax=Larimichthys crocea TaxID=215358 RepID=UPI000900F4D7|nr:centrosomal protein of 131 kDa isoform X1 [Larimichthys crocea]XP_027144839.1 centrosomal protein of 131 kDa isoform X1 [Larimichthys crocea]